MDKLQFDDYDKFLVSLGVVLLVSSVAVPWLILREPFDLTIPQEEITNLSPMAQTLISQRHQLAYYLVHAVPSIFGVLLISGFVSVGFGLRGWRNRQRLFDTKTNLEVKKLSLEVTAMTPAEVIDKATNEVIEIEESDLLIDEEGPAPELPSESRTKEYLAIERKLLTIIKECLGNQYKATEYARLGPVQFDLVLEAGIGGDTDLLFEFKSIQKGFKFGWLREVALKTLYMSEVYEDHSINRSSPYVVIVAPSRILESKSLEELTERITELTTNLGRAVQVRFLKEEELQELTCQDISLLLSQRQAA